MHQSLCAISSSCCFFSSASMVWIASFTVLKLSICTLVSSKDSPGAPTELATCAITVAACCRLALSATSVEICRNAGPEGGAAKDLPKVSKASSLLRILIVSCTAAISASRLFTRLSNSPSPSEHFFFRLTKKTLSSSSCSRVSWSTLTPSALCCMVLAFSCSSCITKVLPAAISSSLAAFRDANSSAALFSSSRASFKSFSKSSFICRNMPKIWPL
mmetsp:Transcript_33737/g.73820  ORF Transcript_33737/g.73820 Transcript_33737/m.73820 type:complete len:217 (+) Transcript_33737:888-1538(+)